MTRVILANRARERSLSKGIADFALSGLGVTLRGQQSFVDAGILTDDRIRYGAETDDLTQWEVGYGTWNANTLTRFAIEDSSASGSKVNFADYPDVWVDLTRSTIRWRQRVITAAGGVTHLVTDDFILLNKTVGAATTVTLMDPLLAMKPVTVIDLKGDAATNNITVNGTMLGTTSFVMAFAYQAATFNPLDDGTGYFVT